VHEAVTSPLDAWEAFYVIIGSSAAALTGLQFVVIALVAEFRKESTTSTIDAFGTPTVVHFCAVLLLSAILSSPWPALAGAGLALGACGLAGVVYAALVVRRVRRQTGYRPVFEDWLWHAVLPFVAYAALLVAATTIASHSTGALFAVGAVALLLLFIGIHNAWDTVTYVAVDRPNPPGKPSDTG
jgi:hypothetical protein